MNRVLLPVFLLCGAAAAVILSAAIYQGALVWP